MSITIDGIERKGCLFCAIKRHPTANESQKIMMACHAADFIHTMYPDVSVVRFMDPCANCCALAPFAGLMLGEAMGIPRDSLERAQKTVEDAVHRMVAKHGGGSG